MPIRAIRTGGCGMDMGFHLVYKSQSLNANQGNSDTSRQRDAKVAEALSQSLNTNQGNADLNDYLAQLNKIPESQFLNTDQGNSDMANRRRLHGGGAKSQSLNTDQGNPSGTTCAAVHQSSKKPWLTQSYPQTSPSINPAPPPQSATTQTSPPCRRAGSRRCAAGARRGSSPLRGPTVPASLRRASWSAGGCCSAPGRAR